MQTEPSSSLASVGSVASVFMFAAGGAAAAMCLASSSSGDAAPFVFGVLAMPTIGVTFGAHLFGRGATGAGWGALGVAAAVEAAIGGAVAPPGGALIGLCLSAVIYIVASPALLTASALSRRSERDTGDTMLLWGGVWSAALYVLSALLLWRHVELPAFWIAIAGVVVSLLAAAAAVARAENRRTFAKLAREGKVPGYRVRARVSLDELRELPALFAINNARHAVLERVTMTAVGGSAYRGGLAAEPVALIPRA